MSGFQQFLRFGIEEWLPEVSDAGLVSIVDNILDEFTKYYMGTLSVSH
jgi:hypothetical protein